MSAEQDHRGRGRDRSRPRAGTLVVAVCAALGFLGVAMYGAVADPPPEHTARPGLATGWAGEPGGLQVLGGRRVPGRPAVQRMIHDGVQFTVSVAPARPGPNLVRVDTTAHDGADRAGHHGAAEPVVRVGVSGDGTTVRARPRPGVDGLWAVVDLPEGSAMVLVSHGPEHRIPFVVSTGSAAHRPDSGPSEWAGPNGPECLARATGALLSGRAPEEGCPTQRLPGPDRDVLASVVRTLAERGVREVAVVSDASRRSTEALAAVHRVAAARRVRVVGPDAKPGERSALLVVSGWSKAAQELAQVSAMPLREQPIRSDGTWLAPWLLSPGVIDSTSGAMIPLGFDIRDRAALAFSQALRHYLPGQAPTAAGFAGWRGNGAAGAPRLYAASRAAYMPANGSHAGHETTVAWFPGGTITPVAALRVG